MLSQDPHESAIDAIYEAAADPSKLPEALNGLAKATNSLCATHFDWDAGPNCLGTFVASSNYSGNDEYLAYYNRLDPRRPLTQALPAGAIFRCHDAIDEDFVRRSEFYQDFSIKHDRRYLMAYHLQKSGSRSLFAVLHRTPAQGPFSEADAARFQIFAPHLRRAARLQDQLVASKEALRQSESAWSLLPFAVVMVGTGGRVKSANYAAQEIFRAKDGLAIRHGTLVATDHQAATALAAALKAGPESAGRGRRRGATVMVPRDTVRRSYWVTVAPVPLSSTDAGPSLMVLITDPERNRAPSADQLGALFQMTSAEAHVALALCQGARVEDIAEERCVSVGTVRSQVKAVLRKTETDRQAELVRSMLAIPVLREPEEVSAQAY